MKLIICDMSGIVTDRGRRNENLLGTMQDLVHYQCSFCTGKGYRGAIDALRGFHFKLPLICENGSLITDVDGTVLYNDCMNYANVDRLIHSIKDAPFEFLAYVDIDSHRYKFLQGKKKLSESLSQPWFFSEEIYSDVESFLENIDHDRICRITTRGLELNQYYSVLDSFHVVNSEKEFHSFCSKGINKGSGVIKLASLLGFDLKDVIIIGNDENDVDMFQLKECYKIVTGINAPPLELQQLADMYVPINELPAYLKKLD